MATYVYDPTATASGNYYSTATGLPGTPGPADTVYVITIPPTGVYAGNTFDNTADLASPVTVNLSNGFSIDTLFLVGGISFTNPSAPSRVPTSTAAAGPVNAVVGAGATVTVATLSGQSNTFDVLGALQGAIAVQSATPPGVSTEISEFYGSRNTLRNTTTSGTLTLAGNSTLNVGQINSGVTIAFQGANATVNISAGAGSVTIDTIFSGFNGAGDSIDLRGAGKLASVNGNTITTQAGNSYTFTGLGAQAFTASTDAAGTGIVISAACYAQGTRILTDAGEVAIEDLRAGDRLVSAVDGVARPVVWIGSRPTGPGERPVRVRAHAFADNVPCRDLVLSPDHAVFFAGALIPVRHLIDHDAVTIEPATPITCWHVELARHDIIVANGMAAESYLDTGDRTGPYSRQDGLPVYAAARAWEATGCAPLAVSGQPVAQARALLASRGSRLAA